MKRIKNLKKKALIVSTCAIGMFVIGYEGLIISNRNSIISQYEKENKEMKVKQEEREVREGELREVVANLRRDTKLAHDALTPKIKENEKLRENNKGLKQEIERLKKENIKLKKRVA